IEAQIISERQLPHLGPDSHHRALGLGLGDALAQVVPGSNIHFTTSFLPCVFFGQSHHVDIDALPQRETVTALLTLPIDLLGLTASGSEEEESESNGNGSNRLSDTQVDLDDEESASDPTRLSASLRSSHHFSSGSSAPISDDGSSSLVASTSMEFASDSFSEAHLLLPRYPSDCVPVAVFCIATHDELYGIVASALMRRHTLGIDTPLLSLSFSPEAWKVQLVIGWPSTRTDHDCVDLHIAHAPLTQGEDHSLGVFDVSSFASLRTLFNFLVALAPALATPMADAQEMIRSQSLPERLMRRADGAAVGSVHHDFQARIEAWLRGFSSSDVPDSLSQEESTSGLDLKDLKDERERILQDIASPDEYSVLLYVRPLFIRSCATEDEFGIKFLSRAPSRAKRFISTEIARRVLLPSPKVLGHPIAGAGVPLELLTFVCDPDHVWSQYLLWPVTRHTCPRAAVHPHPHADARPAAMTSERLIQLTVPSPTSRVESVLVLTTSESASLPAMKLGGRLVARLFLVKDLETSTARNSLESRDRRVNWLSYGIACKKRPSIRYYAPLGSNQGTLWEAIGTGQAAIQTGTYHHFLMVLLESNAVVHPWPTPDFPDDLSGIDMAKTICQDYVYAYKFPESTNGDGLDAFSAKASQAWGDYADAVAEDDTPRATPPLTAEN
ncbi:hypothetical protein K525DRAFT_245037, partial [Schizophyllum commune Loenen D]